MTDAVARQEPHLNDKIQVCRRELKNIKDQVQAIKRMFLRKFKYIENLLKDNRKRGTFPAQEGFAGGTDAGAHGMALASYSIGVVESCFKEKNGTPRQPSISQASKAKLTLSSSVYGNPHHALEGLEQFSHVWLVFLFHENSNKRIKAKVRPPRLDGASVGVFATRSPHRPVPIGLSLVKLDSIKGNTLYLSGVDLLNGTPVLDIKPYIPEYDAPQAPVGAKDDACLATSVENLKEDSMMDVESSTTNSLSNLACPQTKSTSVAEWVTDPVVTEIEVLFSERAEAHLQMFSCRQNATACKHSTIAQGTTLNVQENENVGVMQVSLEDGTRMSAEVDDSKEMYTLEMFSSLQEAKLAIVEVLRADPRSVYRRNCCAEQIYYFSLDKMNLGCKFGDGWVKVLSIFPVALKAEHHLDQ